MQLNPYDPEHYPVWGLAQAFQTPSLIGSIDLTSEAGATVYTPGLAPESFSHREVSAALEWLCQQWKQPLNGCIVGRYFRRDPEALQYDQNVISAAV